MRRKGEVDTMHVVIGAILLLIVLTVSIIIYNQFYGKEVDITRCHIANLKEDCDCDGVANAVDNCPCPGSQDEENCDKLTKCFDPKTCKCHNECT